MEVELKLAIPAASIPALRRHPLIAKAIRRSTSTLDNTYFDTPELHLLHKQAGLRVRKHGRRLLQTVKCSGEVTAGLSARNEWEQPFRGHFDFSAIGDAGLSALLERHRVHLAPVFSTRFRRECWIVHPQPGCEIEVALDRGDIVAATQNEPICELELELHCGSRSQLLDFALALAQQIPLVPVDHSKAERGYALFEHRDIAVPRRAQNVPLDPSQTPVAAFCTIAWECLGQIAANMRGAGEGDDPEFAHQMRVGVRRLRSAVRLFRPLLPAESVEEIRSRSRELAAIPAATREWDVLIHDIVEPAARHAPGHAGLVELIDCARTRRDAERDNMRAALRTPASGAVLLALMLAVERLSSRPADTTQPELAAFAAIRVSRLGRRAMRVARAAGSGEPEDLHMLRLALKRLRYSLEFAGPLVRARHGVTARKLSSLQASLGLLNDLHVSGPLVESLAAQHPQLVPAIALVGGHHLAVWHELASGIPLRGIPWKKLARGWVANR